MGRINKKENAKSQTAEQLAEDIQKLAEQFERIRSYIEYMKSKGIPFVSIQMRPFDRAKDDMKLWAREIEDGIDAAEAAGSADSPLSTQNTSSPDTQPVRRSRKGDKPLTKLQTTIKGGG